MSRRALAGAVGGVLLGAPRGHAATGWAAIEARLGGRLGVAVLGEGPPVAYRGDERFAMCSTHKALSAASILARVDSGTERLDRRIRFAPDAVLPYSPVTEPRAGGVGMTLGELCEAAVTLSDNTAGNLLLDALGGPAGLTSELRRFGDDVTRLDRREPALNEAAPDDPRDTTTPLAMAATLQRFVLGAALSPSSRDQLARWLLGCRTSDTKLRAGVPPGWRVGDRTGAGGCGTVGDAGVLWPPIGPAIVVAVYITGSDAPMAAKDAAINEIAAAITR